MNKDLIKIENRSLTKSEPRNITLKDKSKYFEHVENLNLNQNINISTTVNGNLITSNIIPNNEFYNLFVLDGEDFAKCYFIINKKDCLKYIDKQISALFSLSNSDSLNKCLTYPCLFANKNNEYLKAGNDQLSYFGYLAKIEIGDTNIKFYFSIVSSLPQAIFNDYAQSFNLMESKGDNELDKVHWSIKNINLVKCIRNLGFNVASY